MTAIEAYELIRKEVDQTFKANSCREYNSFYMFLAGGINVICVDKDTGEIGFSELRRMPFNGWRFVDID